MRTRTLGEGGPEVSVVGLGTNNFGARCDLEQSRAVIEAALDEGVTLIDTADIYGAGASEEVIAEALHPYPEGVAIATKGGLGWGLQGRIRDGRPEYLRQACDASERATRSSRPCADLRRVTPAARLFRAPQRACAEASASRTL